MPGTLRDLKSKICFLPLQVIPFTKKKKRKNNNNNNINNGGTNSE